MFHILYIDDESDICELFGEFFETDKIKVTSFTNPEIALNNMNTTKFDLVFVDYRLPNTTGDMVASQMDPSIPKALITGDLNVQSKFKFVRIFSKPMNIQEINGFISNYL